MSFPAEKTPEKTNVRYLYWKASVTWVKCPTFLSSFGPPIVKSLTSSYQSLTTPAQLRSYPAEAKFCPTENRPVDIECMLFRFIQSFSHVLNVFTIRCRAKEYWLDEIISLRFRTILSITNFVCQTIIKLYCICVCIIYKHRNARLPCGGTGVRIQVTTLDQVFVVTAPLLNVCHNVWFIDGNTLTMWGWGEAKRAKNKTGSNVSMHTDDIMTSPGILRCWLPSWTKPLQASA